MCVRVFVWGVGANGRDRRLMCLHVRVYVYVCEREDGRQGGREGERAK